jgi:hypothetical protein
LTGIVPLTPTGKEIVEIFKEMDFRFVVLHHTGLKTGNRGDHWDWLLELPKPSMAKKTSKDCSHFMRDLGLDHAVIAAGLSQQGPDRNLIAFATEAPLLSQPAPLIGQPAPLIGQPAPLIGQPEGAGLLLDAWVGGMFLRLPMHRDIYLSYEGSISGGRGHVSRVGMGALRWLEIGPFQLRFEILNAEFFGVSSHIATPAPYFLSPTKPRVESSKPWSEKPWSDPEPDDSPRWALHR